MTNINIEIPDELHKKIKILCAIKETTLKEFVITALQEKTERDDPNGED